MPNLSTAAYKGTRDFYPNPDQFTSLDKDLNFYLYQKYIIDTWRKTLNQYGFVEYEASVLESAELYIHKSGEELGGKQLYSFLDKGGRKLALRPEMTPTVARMVADKYEQLRLPLRWFSIPNCFRYERPQKGRLREHWQLNVDILGLESGGSDIEILMILPAIFENFGAKKEQFKIYYNHRQVMDWFLKDFLQIPNHLLEIIKVIDDYRKFDLAQNFEFLQQYTTAEKAQKIIDLCSNQNSLSYQSYLKKAEENPEIQLLNKLTTQLYPETEIAFNPTIIRGQAYYTGIVFEAFDKDPNNPRSLVGGGRYDNLMELFDKPKLPGVGFGSGDVTCLEFLQNWNLLDGSPQFEDWKRSHQPTKNGIMILAQNLSEAEQVIGKIYSEILPKLKLAGETWEIDYDYSRSENKRFQNLKKRGCAKIIKID